MRSALIRYQLFFGPYRTPRFKIGSVGKAAIRGKVKIIDVSDARIPWPVSMNWTKRSLVVYGGLARVYGWKRCRQSHTGGEFLGRDSEYPLRPGPQTEPEKTILRNAAEILTGARITTTHRDAFFTVSLTLSAVFWIACSVLPTA